MKISNLKKLVLLWNGSYNGGSIGSIYRQREKPINIFNLTIENVDKQVFDPVNHIVTQMRISILTTLWL